MTLLSMERLSWVSSAVLLALIVLFEYIIPPTHSGFFCNDPALSAEYSPAENDSSFEVVVWCLFTFGILSIVAIEFLQHLSCNIPKAPLESLLKIFTAGYCLTLFLGSFTRTLSGRKVPFFLSYCQPKSDQLLRCMNDSLNETVSPSSLLNSSVSLSSSSWSQNVIPNRLVYIDEFECEINSRSLSRSFYSAECSQASFTLLFLVLHLHTTMLRSLLRSFVQLAFLMFVVWYSLTQYLNHNAHWEDIAVGVGVGLAFALVSHSKLLNCSSYSEYYNNHHFHQTVRCEQSVVYSPRAPQCNIDELDHLVDDGSSCERDSFVLSEPIGRNRETHSLIALRKSHFDYNSI